MQQKKHSFKKNLHWLGIAIALTFWVVESAIDTFIFLEGSFSQRLISPDPNEAWMRFFIAGIIVGFGIFAQKAFNREEKAHVKSLERSENRFRKIFDHSNDAIFLFDPVPDEILEVNNKACVMLGFTREELLFEKVSDVLQDEGLSLKAFIQSILENNGDSTDKLACWTKGGTRIPTEISASLIDLHGRTCVIALVRDITERRHIEKLERLSSIVFKNATEAIMVTDADANILSVNPAFIEISGYSEEEVLGQNPRIFQSGKHDEAFYKKMWNSLHTTGHWEGELWDRRKNGEIYPKWLSITEVKHQHGDTAQYTGLFTDITERKISEDKLYHQANYDFLTGLVKRELFSIRLSEAVEMAATNLCNAAVLFIDLDKFKRANDSLGHLVGDELLKMSANRLGSCIRGNDTLSRQGGDEFLIVLADIYDQEEILIVAERIIEKFSRPFRVNGNEVFLGTSIGIAISPKDGKEVVGLINKADKAMYKVKISGRNNWHFFSDKTAEDAIDNTLMEQDLKHAIENQELRMCYQPIVDLKTGETSSFEALIRWDHPYKGTIMPGQFIPIAEKNGLIAAISTWVFKATCTQLKDWQDRFGPNIVGSINMSSKNFLDSETLLLITKTLDKSELSPNSLIIEITEKTLINQDDVGVLNKLAAIKESGVQVAIDNFGAGYASLSLAKYPIDILKIDKSIILNIGSDLTKQPTVDAIIHMGKSLGLEIIAEGVENHKDSAYLLDIGCEKAQGYYFSKPLSAKAYEAELK